MAAAVAAALGLTGAAALADAQDCPGNPDALGTSRVIAIDPAQYGAVGTMQYPQTLPLDDHEVVLTFDDGPLPPSSNKILDILASQCVKATYFLVGGMARAFPDAARRIHAEGHTIGTHSQNHPINIGRLPDERVKQEIDDGIASVTAALGDPSALAPFFRIPGLGRSAVVDGEIDAHGLVVFSADVVADDWHRRITPAQIITRAMQRLEAKGKGILLLHDIHPKTAIALPGLLKELKDHGFRIVQVVPGGPASPRLVAGLVELTVAWSAANQEMLDDSGVKPIWPALDAKAMNEGELLPTPGENPPEVSYPTARTLVVAEGDDELPVAIAANWPDAPQLDVAAPEPQLPVPSVGDIGWPVHEEAIVERHEETDLRLGVRKSADAASSAGHGKLHTKMLRHARLKPQSSRRRNAHAPASSGQHASLAAKIAALFTTAK